MCLIIYIFLFVVNNIFTNADDFNCGLDSDFILSNDNGPPVFLTPYVRNGEIEAARKVSQVGIFEGVPFILSYSGFFTVNQEYNSNIFFWFIPATNCDRNAPVIIWLQGGPGASGLEGLFLENGPYVVHANYSIGLSEVSWTQKFHMIYVDNPVGCGFSFTDDERGYSRNQEQVTDNLYEFLQQFFTIYHEYRKNDFYVAGESYGGKHAPSLAYRIHINGPSSKINLKGISIGNGFTHPQALVNNSVLFYQLGLLDHLQASVIQNSSERILEHMDNKEFDKVGNKLDLFIANDPYSIEHALVKYSGYKYFYNLLKTVTPVEFSYFKCYVQLPQFRKAAHVGNLQFRGNHTIRHFLQRDFLHSVQDEFVVLMNNYKVLCYNGQLDMSIPYVATAEWLRNLEWKYAKQYRITERRLWKIDGTKFAGYIHNFGDFYHALVLGAGHIVPHDKPIEAYDLISRFVSDTLV